MRRRPHMPLRMTWRVGLSGKRRPPSSDRRFEATLFTQPGTAGFARTYRRPEAPGSESAITHATRCGNCLPGAGFRLPSTPGADILMPLNQSTSDRQRPVRLPGRRSSPDAGWPARAAACEIGRRCGRAVARAANATTTAVATVTARTAVRRGSCLREIRWPRPPDRRPPGGAWPTGSDDEEDQ
jgi:hypothetical protein